MRATQRSPLVPLSARQGENKELAGRSPESGSASVQARRQTHLGRELVGADAQTLARASANPNSIGRFTSASGHNARRPASEHNAGAAGARTVRAQCALGLCLASGVAGRARVGQPSESEAELFLSPGPGPANAQDACALALVQR